MFVHIHINYILIFIMKIYMKYDGNNKIIYLGNRSKFNKKNIFDEILEIIIK